MYDGAVIRALPIVVSLAACSSPPHPVITNEGTHARYKTLGERLLGETGAGEPVAIVGGAKGIRAISGDGSRQTALTHEPNRWVLVDARANVIWFGGVDGTDYRAIDLDQPPSEAPHVETVVTGMPSPSEVEMVGPAYFGVAYPTPGEPLGMFAEAPDFAIGTCCAHATIALFVSPMPSVSASPGYQQNDEWSAKMAAAALPGRAFLVALAARPDHRKPTKTAPPAKPDKLAGVDPANCMEADLCGASEAIAGTHFTRVIVAQAMGDVGHITHQLYDTTAKKLVDAEWGTWMQNAWVAPDGSGFIHDGVLVRFDRGPIAATPVAEASLGGGWLGGGEFYGF